MRLAEDRPLLGKTRGDLTRAVGEIDRNIENVLHHARFLIVSFFNEKRVVLDSFGQWLGGDRSSDQRNGACHNQKTSDGNKDARSCTKRRELRMFHTRQGYLFNLSAGIA